MAFGLKKRSFYWTQELAMVPSTNRHFYRSMKGPIPKCGHVALVLDCCYVDICVIFSSSGSLRMRSISQFSRASGARFSETDDSPETGSREMDLTGEIESASWIFNPFAASGSS